MEITRDVILDLLPLYLAGEATPATMRLVDEYLDRDPTLAAEVRGARNAPAWETLSPEPPLSEPSSPAPGIELDTFRRARRQLTVRRWLFGAGCFFSALSASVEMRFGDGALRRMHFVVLEYFAALWWIPLLAVCSWTAYLAARRRAAL